MVYSKGKQGIIREDKIKMTTSKRSKPNNELTNERVTEQMSFRRKREK